MKSLVAYFSHAGENYGVSETKIGNGKYIADYLTELTGSDEFEIKTKEEYPFDYDDCCKMAQKEKKFKARPELTKYIDTLENYDNIYLIYPMWWGTCPMAVFSFLEHNNFANKHVYLFSTHEGSGFESSIMDIAKVIPKALVKEGLAIYGHDAKDSKSVLEKWVSIHEDR